MARPNFSLENATFRAPTREKTVLDYHPMRATNPHTGKLQEVILIDPHQLQNRVAVESYPELRADLNRAFGAFNKIQKRVLVRILVQGQSIELATRGLQRTSMWWRTWFNRTALPQLRKSLADYSEHGKLVLS